MKARSIINPPARIARRINLISSTIKRACNRQARRFRAYQLRRSMDRLERMRYQIWGRYND